jgi:hypothetical protein
MPALWINDGNKLGGGYFAPARNQIYVNAMARKWIKWILAVASIPALIALVAALGEVSK